MEVDTGQKHVLTACQDRQVRVYNVNTGKHTKSFRGSTGDDGTLIKVGQNFGSYRRFGTNPILLCAEYSAYHTRYFSRWIAVKHSFSAISSLHLFRYILSVMFQMVMDRSGIYLATSCTDKSLSVYDYYSGECMATMCGHSELATGLRFTNDCRRLISASGDG